jgi:FkbM family methyltransferase
MNRTLHAAIIEKIRAMPPPSDLFLLRVYNRVLKTLRSEYRARTYFNAQIYCDPTDLLQGTLLLFGMWEPDVSKVIERNLSPGDVFVDVGANVGYDTLLASGRVGPTGKVVAIEASPRTFRLLTRNLELNDAANVRAVNVAVFGRVAKLDLYEGVENNIGSMTTLGSRGGKRVTSVDAMPLDKILTADEISRLRLIKMDVEGAEPPILQNLLDALPLFPPTMDIIVEVSPHDDHAAWQSVFDRMRAAGFFAYEIENSYSIEWYLRWRGPAPLREAECLPTQLQDLLFTRGVGAGQRSRQSVTTPGGKTC